MGKALSALKSQEEAFARIERFLSRARDRCKELGWEFIGLYLVGSRARGDYLANSDIDLVLVVKGVKSLKMLQRLEALKDILEPGIDLRIYDAEEWFNSKSAWIKKLREEAIEIK